MSQGRVCATLINCMPAMNLTRFTYIPTYIHAQLTYMCHLIKSPLLHSEVTSVFCFTLKSTLHLKRIKNIRWTIRKKHYMVLWLQDRPHLELHWLYTFHIYLYIYIYMRPLDVCEHQKPTKKHPELFSRVLSVFCV